MAADFSALGAKCGNDMLFGHAPNLGADPIHYLWQLRHNIAVLRLTVPSCCNVAVSLGMIRANWEIA
jgi:hypothetical protein